MRAGRIISALLILCAISLTALWIRSSWLMDDVGIQYVTRARPGVMRMLRFHSIPGSIKFSVTVVYDAPGTAALTIDPTQRDVPGFSGFTNFGLDPEGYSYGRWSTEKDIFSLPGFGFSYHGWNSRQGVALGPLATTQPSTTSTVNGYSIWFPHPVLILALLAWPFRRWRRNRRLERRLRAGLCTQCGYDMRATPDQCPECGQRPPSPQTADASI